MNTPHNLETFEVLLCTSPTNMPISFASHPWIVINDHGNVSRWEVLFRKIKGAKRWGHIYENYFAPFQGLEIFPYLEVFFWNSTILAKAEGDLAKKIASITEQTPTTYPYKDTYWITGPNSNTYIQHILDQVPEWDVVLPYNAFGKNYKTKA